MTSTSGMVGCGWWILFLWSSGKVAVLRAEDTGGSVPWSCHPLRAEDTGVGQFLGLVTP